MDIKTAYEIGDRPWMIIDGNPQQVTVVGLNIICKQNEVRGVYVVRHGIAIMEVLKDSLYPTKEELLKTL
jgi:hypothetical protein